MDRDLVRIPDCLKTLNLEKSDLTCLPDSVSTLAKYLQNLHLADNFLTTLPENLFELLVHLTWFDVRFNQLTSIPKSIRGHVHIRTILLQGNNLELEQVAFDSLQNCQNNAIKVLESDLAMCPNLRHLQIANNPIRKPPMDYLEAEGVIPGIAKYYFPSHDSIKGIQDCTLDPSSTYLEECKRLRNIDMMVFETIEKADEVDEDEDAIDIREIRRVDRTKRRELIRKRLLKQKSKAEKKDKLIIKIIRRWRLNVFMTTISKQAKEIRKEKNFFSQISENDKKLKQLRNQLLGS